MDVFATLKRSWIGRRVCLECQKYCTQTAKQPAIKACGRLRDTIPINTKKKHTEIVPVTPGRRSLKPAAMIENAKYSRKLVRSSGRHDGTLRARFSHPIRTTSAMKTLALT